MTARCYTSDVPKQVVMTDVARAAGVSAQTVSRVIHRSSSVSEKTRRRVEQAILELNYQPNISAQHLASRGTNTVGLLTIGHIYHGIRSTYIAIEQELRSDGMFLVSASASEEDPDAIIAAINYLKRQRTLALIVLLQRADVLPLLTRELTGQSGVLVMSGGHRIPHFVTISHDQIPGTTQVTEHLIEQCEGIGLLHVAGPLQAQDSVERLTTFQEVCQRHRVVARWVGAAGWSAHDGYEIAREILAHPPTAIFAANDDLAIGIAHALYEQGLTAGKDYALAGFDDLSTAAYLNPPLTSVTQKSPELTKPILNAIKAIRSGDTPDSFSVPTTLVIRESSLLKSED